MIVEGDCIEIMAGMADGSVDAIVTDPPYGLSAEPDIAEVLRHWLAGDDYRHRGGGFMGKSWDSFVPGPVYWREAFRVLKPGGHLVAFGGSRTYDLLAIAVRLAGFEVRDQLQWLYGSGFPKSLDVSKAIDRAAGAEREILGPDPNWRSRAHTESVYDGGLSRPENLTAPATPDAEQWQGWGTALKPAHEPIVLARKPLIGTVASNVLAHGTGALNIEACRIGDTVETWPTSRSFAPGISAGYTDGIEKGPTQATGDAPAGRWPANVLLDEDAAALLDSQTGESVSRIGRPRGAAAGDGWGMTATGAEYEDSGGASRFFYVAKASTAERNAGLDGFPLRDRPAWSSGTQNPGSFQEGETGPTRNVHPTVKPIEVMRWLIRLITPPGGLVLDPFTGSGTTGCAAALERVEFVGIERQGPRWVAEHPDDDDYVAIAEARVAWWQLHPEGLEIVKAITADRARRAVADSGQLDLLA